jgi:hypothetical protein
MKNDDKKIYTPTDIGNNANCLIKDTVNAS